MSVFDDVCQSVFVYRSKTVSGSSLSDVINSGMISF